MGIPFFWVERWEATRSLDPRGRVGNQEAREPIKLACQTLNKGNVRKEKAICTQGQSSKLTNLVSGPQDIKQDVPPEWGRLGSGPPGRRARAERWECLGRELDDKTTPTSPAFAWDMGKKF